MGERLVYVVRQRNGRYIGTKRFSFSNGTYNADVPTIASARIFSKAAHAMTAAPIGAKVVGYRMVPAGKEI